MSFKNRIRLPFYVTRPQYPREANVFRRADGSTKVQSVIIRKVFEGETDNLPKEIHERLIIALSHDDVTIEGRYLSTGVSLEGNDYDIEWTKFLDFPLAKAAFKVQVTPFNYSNDNCQTCEELSQVVCVDDNIGTIDEDETVSVPVLDNDSICCSPVVISLVSFNTTYLDSCIISGSDIIIHAKPLLSDANSIVLATYRARCPNGSYDEANIIGDINGTDPTPTCLAPLDPILVSLDSDTSASFSWTAPSPAPACGYHWEVRRPVTGEVIASGDAAGVSVAVTGLPSNENFLRFYVRSNCCSLDSNYAGPVIFSLPPPSDTEACGNYQIDNTHFLLYGTATYLDCNGVEQNVIVPASQTRFICALQSSPGVPVEISTSGGNLIITYTGLC
jgi:hypothetical protein